MDKKAFDYNNIPKDKFEFCQRDESIHDKKFDTKPVGYFKDAMMRFCRNKSSIVAAFIILFLVLFAVFVPIFCSNKYTSMPTDTTYLQYTKLLPKWDLFAWAGMDGCTDMTLNKDNYYKKLAIAEETGVNPIVKVYKADYVDASSTTDTTFYDVRIDSYTNLGMTFLTLTEEEYKDIQEWQKESGIQVIYPAVDTSDLKIATLKNDASIWYKCTNKGMPKLDKDGHFQPMYKTTGSDGGYDSLRIAGDDGSYRYAVLAGTSEATSYKVRVFLYNYFQYRYGFEPAFVFGTNAYGQDILTRLAGGMRFSLVFAICISAVNLFIGAIFGAIEGYYGGKMDLILERIKDILGNIPFIVAVTLFQLHLAQKVGPIVSLLFAYVLTGWTGMAARVRMQFYRYKNQEYILAARTLGASDARLMFKHIFPNALGTLITGSILVIPSTFFSESNLTYLGIVNLDTSTRSSIGSMLAAGQPLISSYPHIMLFPAIVISLMMISFNLFGNGLRDAFNPSLRGTED
ncbi:MAG: ABC transporter permease [Lachnospiraceae bacterium]|nr:ABC transporter permease [Lachnospiraceae bacterium]